MKQLARYQINFDSKWIQWSGALMGAALFLRMLYFFVLSQLSAHTVAQWICLLLLPALVQVGWIVLVRIVKLKASGVFGILGAVTCILLMIQAFLLGSALQMILAALFYLLSAGLVLMITGGFFPYKYFGMLAFALIGILRFVLFDLSLIRSGEITDVILAIPALCMVAAIACFFGGITGVKNAN